MRKTSTRKDLGVNPLYIKMSSLIAFSALKEIKFLRTKQTFSARFYDVNEW